MNDLTIIHLGPGGRGETAQHRADAMESLGHRVHRVFYRLEGETPAMPLRLHRALWRRLGFPRERCGENEALLRAADCVKPDLLWIEKGLTIRPETLAEIRRRSPRTLQVSYSPDDMLNPDNTSRHYWRCLRLYDLHVTTKRHNAPELLARGARRVEFAGNGYAPEVHRPVALTEADRARFGADAGFVGDYEDDRARQVARLAEAGIPVRIWGTRWHRLRRPPANLRIEGRGVYAEEYAKVLCATRVNLCFLRKSNRDTATTRSVEIPACGAFMLAERTPDHEALFAERREAEFFGTVEELISKTRHYLDCGEERRRIAAAGHIKCMASPWSNAERLAAVLETCRRLRAEGG